MDGFEQNGEILHSEIEYTKIGYFHGKHGWMRGFRDQMLGIGG
ncbi:hypothetical protein LEP1GSC062_1030 [Leptospira alexanderi serovar Manhao 3 str. L 60]|uniref:Uncharacterized protein n=1 Tax=Leptospira alexanderi serovar Manhao 3 str. L 60 TaxID=1049759 RepID=V6I0L5_9LEPT|nr:hypothetical protein LEP1GSC062_1030 [Leptospira alexanderi serovar Manhao 3 str. L 60]